jgi:hypothetical protein
MDLNILPPDTDTFITKKQTSERQKAHLKKAREIAKQRQIKPKNEEINDNQSVENESADEEIEEQQPIITKPTQKAVKKLPAKKKTDKYRLTPEEIAEREDLEKFEKFMKHMNKYEQVKEKMRQEEEDKKKIHIKYTQEEYDELLKILKIQEERDEEQMNKPKEPEIKTPVQPSKNESQNPMLLSSQFNRNRVNNFRRTRFGV